ncbi:MAG: bifunctional diaminohydroxyphosphoribosylaminopyrimidine deaminase/5-amino-6-(5-phosphoribosylamino)uracil reductase RibD [Chitinophagaceae bacterium]
MVIFAMAECKCPARNHVINLILSKDEKYMRRCLELAARGSGLVAPNPMVGAVLVFEDRIIGEGWHAGFGGPHAEVNCIREAMERGGDEFFNRATLFVSLEPCSHFGKTPPCTDLIIRHRIPRVVIGIRDPFAEVNGKGIEKLKQAGVEVVTGILEKECGEQNRRFMLFHTRKRPYVILKWAQTADGFIAASAGLRKQSRLHISNEISNRLVHRWRTEEASILVGTNTARLDNPELNNRFWPGKSPVRLVIDKNLSLPHDLRLFDGTLRTIVFNRIRQEENGLLQYYQIGVSGSWVRPILEALYKMDIQSVLVEGGAGLLRSFIEEELWDEARVITNTGLETGEGLPAPVLERAERQDEQNWQGDRVQYFKPLI